MFISLLLADAKQQTGFDPLSLLPIVLIFGVFYFLILRPQQKKMKEHQETVSQIRRGDKVIINSALMGTVHRIIDEKEMYVEIAKDVHIKCLKGSVTQVIQKGTLEELAS
jgi:preprotein translocase subunit YajC